MSEKILVPALGESITEATVSKWLKKVGDSVDTDEALVELETDKVNLEVPSPISGSLAEINFKDGDTVEVGAVLGLISEEKSKIDVSKSKTIEKKTENINKEENINLKSNIVNLEIEKKKTRKIRRTIVIKR